MTIKQILAGLVKILSPQMIARAAVSYATIKVVEKATTEAARQQAVEWVNPALRPN